MPLTGELVERSDFDATADRPEALAASGERLFMFARTRGYAVDTSQTPWTVSPFTRVNYANADNSFSNSNVRSATWRNGKLLVIGLSPTQVLLEIDPDTGDPISLGATPSEIAAAQAIAYNASEDRVYALDTTADALFKMTVLGPNVPNTAEQVGQATQFGNWRESLPRGLAWYRGQLVGIGSSTRRFAIINPTDGTAEPQGISTADVERQPFGLTVHAGDLIVVGSQHDKIYRCRDVRWHDSIPDITLDARDTETLDLATVSQDAETYAFKTGYTPPNWITRNGSVLTIAAPAVNADTTETVQLTVSRSVSGTTFSEDTEIAVRVKDISPKRFSYQGYPVAITVKIHDQDVTNAIAALDTIAQGIDYPNLTEFRVGEASFTLRDVHGDFSPNNPSNFFTRHGGQRTGHNSPVQIKAGFIVDGSRYTHTVFQGTIIRLVQDAKGATVKVVCSDNFGDMRKKTIADFGIARHFMLLENLEALAHNAGNGFYPILDAILPASDGSVAISARVGDALNLVQKLETEGSLNPRNFVVNADGIRTEGGFIVNRQVGYPQIKMKSPFRYRHIKDIITDILNHAGITQSDISIPEQDVDAHFSSNGRINYDLIGTSDLGSGNPITWNGTTTDFIHDSGTWYFLYNGGRNNPNGISQIIVYDVATRTYNRLHKFAAATEVWKFFKSGDIFYILATTGGNYDANAVSSENQILRLDISGTPTETVFVPHTNALKPQLAHYYAGVGAIHMRPDTRRQLIYRQNDGLYYAFVDRTNSTFGVAKATAENMTTPVISVNIDTYGNHGGITFSIDTNDMLKGGTTFLSNRKSQILGFIKAL